MNANAGCAPAANKTSYLLCIPVLAHQFDNPPTYGHQE